MQETESRGTRTQHSLYFRGKRTDVTRVIESRSFLPSCEELLKTFEHVMKKKRVKRPDDPQFLKREHGNHVAIEMGRIPGFFFSRF